MSDISSLLPLSLRYTNHSLRATAITVLGEKFQDTDVSTVSGHKSISNLVIYKTTSLEKKKEMSAHLHRAILSNVVDNNIPTSSSAQVTGHAEEENQVCTFVMVNSIISTPTSSQPTSSHAEELNSATNYAASSDDSQL